LTAGQVAAAKPLVQAILQADEHDPAGLYLKGRVAFAERDLLQAAGLFEEVIGRDATLVGPHLYLGLIRSTQGRTDEAEEELREATRRDPSNQAAHLALARLYLTQQKQAESEKEVLQTLRLNPANLEAAVLYGDVSVFGKNWSKAEEVYGAIIRQLPGQPIGYVKMAALRKLQARPAETAQLYAQALSHAADDLVILQDYLVSLVESQQAQQADRVLGEYLTKASRDPNMWRLAGRVYAAQRKIDQAEKAFRKAVDFAPDLALAHYELGQLYVLENKLPAAVSAFQAALKQDEANSAIHTALGMVLARRGQVDAANGHYKRAFQLNPRDVVAANNLAANLGDQQDLDDALGFARDALELAPSNPAIKDTLGWIYYKQGRFDKAYPFLAEASAALPQHPVVRYHHAVALSKIGKQNEALSELKTALSLPGSFPEAERAARMVAANKIDE
jgi:tetratricopeptide (TPR) repeat protein